MDFLLQLLESTPRWVLNITAAGYMEFSVVWMATSSIFCESLHHFIFIGEFCCCCCWSLQNFFRKSSQQQSLNRQYPIFPCHFFRPLCWPLQVKAADQLWCIPMKEGFSTEEMTSACVLLLPVEMTQGPIIIWCIGVGQLACLLHPHYGGKLASTAPAGSSHATGSKGQVQFFRYHALGADSQYPWFYCAAQADLQSASAGKGQNQLSHSYDPRPALLPASGGEGQRGKCFFLLPMPPWGRKGVGKASSHTLMLSECGSPLSLQHCLSG